MALPPDESFTSTHGQPLSGPHPTGTFLFTGHQSGVARAASGGMGITICVINVFGRKHGGAQTFCVEKVFTSVDGRVTQTHKWKTEDQYAAEHMRLWREFDMEPNRGFNVGEGLRAETGGHLRGSNELCERDGTLKSANIRSRC